MPAESEDVLREGFLRFPRFRAGVLGYRDLEPFHDSLFAQLERRYPRTLYLLPRGSFKSSLIVINYVIGEILRDRNRRVLITSENYALSARLLSEIKQHLTLNPVILSLFGNLKTDPGWKEGSITIAGRTKPHKEPTIDCAGMDVERTGNHYELIIGDDIVGEQNVGTSDMRERTWRYVQNLFPILEPTGQLILDGTKWDMDDVYGRILEDTERNNNSLGFHIFHRKSREDGGALLMPKRLNREFLDRQLSLLGPYVFSAQYQNISIPSENRTFLPPWLRNNYWDKLPKRTDEEFFGRFTTVDPALGEDRKHDRTFIVTCDHTRSGDVYVVDTRFGNWAPEETVAQICKTLVQLEPDRWGIEEIAFQRVFRIWIQREFSKLGIRCPKAEFKTSHIAKDLRIERLQPVAARGQLHLHKDQYELETELLGFPQHRTRDGADALAYQMELSPNVRYKQKMQEESWLEKINRKFKSTFRDSNAGGKQWVKM